VHSAGHEQRAIPYITIRTMLDVTLAATGLTDAAGQPLRSVPHDFRRIFITDAIMHGLPPHIAQILVGHADINTTIGYKAAYRVEAINTYRVSTLT
jgi:integrase